MSLDATRLMALGTAHPLANELKSQVDTDVTAQRDIQILQSGVAAAGTTISGATATTGDIVHVGTVSGSADGIKLRIPTATAPLQRVINIAASGGTLKVYPPNDISFIDAQARAASVSLSAGQSASFLADNVGVTVGSVIQYHYNGAY